MSVTRRDFFRTAGASGAAALAIVTQARAALGALGLAEAEIQSILAADPNAININANENARGPGAGALDAVRGRTTAKVGRYPDNIGELKSLIAQKFAAKPENVLLSTGSTVMLNAAARAFLSPTRPLVSGLPSFEVPVSVPDIPVWGPASLRAPVRGIPLDASLKLDLGKMVAAAKDAGIVYICNPNNPTATAVPGTAVIDAVRQVRKASPDALVVIDEAYIDYATDSAITTAAPIALAEPNVLILRTGSKAYGMAGMRFGYGIGQPKTLQTIVDAGVIGDMNMNVLTAAAAIALLKDPAQIDREREENRRIRDFTVSAFKEMGYTGTDSQANFVFVNIKRPAKEFAAACAKLSVRVGREFPPYEKTHARISLGTSEEMKKAVDAFRRVLTTPATAAALR